MKKPRLLQWLHQRNNIFDLKKDYPPFSGGFFFLDVLFFLLSRGVSMNEVRRFIANCITVFVKNKRVSKNIKCLIKYGKAEKNRQFKYRLAVVAIMKNEGMYLREWIEFHKQIGVEKFYLYDNESTDDTKQVLQPYINSGLVDYVYYPGQKMQMSAYNDCVKKCKNEVKWLAVIDLDEFIVPVKTDSLSDLLDAQNRGFAQFVVPWIVFGSNGHESRPRGLVLESYTKCAKKSWLNKSIVNPRAVINMDCHVHKIDGATKIFSDSVVRVQHYHCKSWEEYKLKAARGDAWFGADVGKEKYQRACFDRHNLNELDDFTALRFVDKIKKRIENK